ncbi:MAG: SCP2 sterol-binding domain-containing protein [Magnetococcus sp. DMHC-6]
MIFSWIKSPLALMPQEITAVGLGVTLNLFFQRYPEMLERLKELSGKIFHFEVEDLDQSFYMLVEPTGEVKIHTYSDLAPNVTMAGSSLAFLSLLLKKSDPDSLFFSRRLKLSGETDTGLKFKNFLDNIEMDWERELSSFFGTTTARALIAMNQRAWQAGERGKERCNEEIEHWMDQQHIPRAEQLEEFRGKVNDLAEQMERLESRISRLTKKISISKSTPRPGSRAAVQPAHAATQMDSIPNTDP